MDKKSNISVERRGVFEEYARLHFFHPKAHGWRRSSSPLDLLAHTFFGFPFDYYYIILAIIAFFLTLIMFQEAGLYRPWRGVEFLRLVRRLCSTWIVVVSILVGWAS